ncbi:FadR/GntR family transcriptional regulator [Cohaesibacter intestini]|uniref:FadR/GntR family transcriptional regulator n=1 Tax=Cohaesibacter intestini TaxID=2211145 RepID=UPI000DE96320|nr:FadR/GntR family transcriptional regulator [Cohaesibacter intestini]
MISNDDFAKQQEPSSADRIVSYFKERILRGELKVGDKIKPERDLAQELSVGRPLLREVLRSLSMLGILDVRHGSGTYIGKVDLSMLSDFFTFCFSQEQAILEDVFQARIAIECQAIRLACERANDVDLNRLGKWLNILVATLEDPEEGGHADFMFHQSIVHASHSQSLITLYGALSELLKRSHIQRRQAFRQNDGVEDLVAAHREVFLSIVAKNADEADRRLREHFAIGDVLRRKNLISQYLGSQEKTQTVN